MHSRHFLDLPLEIIEETLSRLNFVEILHCSMTCRHVHELVKNSVNLQYAIELGACGMVVTDSKTLSTAECHRSLIDRQHAWRMAEWKVTETVPISGHCDAYEFVSGVFAKTMTPGGLSAPMTSRHFTAVWLPTLTQKGRTIVHEELGISTKDFAIDPTQDLLVLVEGYPVIGVTGSVVTSPFGDVNVHIRRLSTNKPHDRARYPVLTRTFAGRTYRRCSVQIADDVVVLLLSGGVFPEMLILIWNWKTGDLLVSRLHYGESFQDISMLSSRAYMVVSLATSSPIQLYTFRNNPLDPGQPPDGTLNPEDNGPDLVCTLDLPALNAGGTIRSISSHTSPFIGGPASGTPFDVSPDARVHVLSIEFRTRQWHWTCLTQLVVRTETLMSYVRNHKPLDDRQPPHYHWDTWGPDNTRFLCPGVRFRWLRYVHGYRVVLPVINAQDLAVSQVLDFNPYCKPSSLPTEPSDGSTRFSAWITEPSMFPQDIFTTHIVTRLPYHRAVFKEPGHHSGFMIDSHRLVGLMANHLWDDDLNDLDVLLF